MVKKIEDMTVVELERLFNEVKLSEEARQKRIEREALRQSLLGKLRLMGVTEADV